MPPSDSPPQTPSYDPTFVHARREAGVILVVWVVFLVWTVGYSALAGYEVAPEAVRIILGMPGWVFWGILVPWIAATIFSVWFGLSYMADDDLEPPDDSEAAHA